MSKDSISEDNVFTDLYDACRMDQSGSLQNFLQSHQRLINLTQEEGILFKIAISHNYIEIFNILMDYYETNYLQKDKQTLEYKIAKHNLTEILQEAADSYNLSNEMQYLLASCTNQEEDSDREGDFSDENLNIVVNNQELVNLVLKNLFSAQNTEQVQCNGENITELQNCLNC